jgi:hypothetical protein
MTRAEKVKIENRQEELVTRLAAMEKQFPSRVYYNNLIEEIRTEFQEELDRITTLLEKRREYIFNFVGGGWNSVHAYYMEEAQSIAAIEYGDLKVDPKSFRESTPEDMKNMLSLFY